MGDDWEGKFDFLKDLCEVVYLPRTPDISTTQIKTLADEVERSVKLAGEETSHREGYRSGGWTLLDFGCVIVHVFTEEARKFYNLERLWSDSEEVTLSSLQSP